MDTFPIQPHGLQSQIPTLPVEYQPKAELEKQHHPVHGAPYNPSLETHKDYIGRILDWIESRAHRYFYWDKNYKAAEKAYDNYARYQRFYWKQYKDLFANRRQLRYERAWTKAILKKRKEVQRLLNQDLLEILQEGSRRQPLIREAVAALKRSRKLPRTSRDLVPVTDKTLQNLETTIHQAGGTEVLEQLQVHRHARQFIRSFRDEIRRYRRFIRRNNRQVESWDPHAGIRYLIESGKVPWKLPKLRQMDADQNREPLADPPAYPYYYTDQVEYVVPVGKDPNPAQSRRRRRGLRRAFHAR